MPFSVINLRIDERERERGRYKIFPSRAREKRREEEKKKSQLQSRVLFYFRNLSSLYFGSVPIFPPAFLSLSRVCLLVDDRGEY